MRPTKNCSSSPGGCSTASPMRIGRLTNSCAIRAYRPSSPKAAGILIEGLDFHRYYFALGPPASPRNTTIAAPHVRVMGDVAVVAYVRLVQSILEGGKTVTTAFEETRVWQRQAA